MVVEWGFLSFGVKPEIFIVEGAQTTPDPRTAGASGHMTTRDRGLRQRSSPSSSPPLLLHHILPSPPHISYFLLSASSPQRPTLRCSQRQRTTTVAGPPQPPQGFIGDRPTDRGYRPRILLHLGRSRIPQSLSPYADPLHSTLASGRRRARTAITRRPMPTAEKAKDRRPPTRLRQSMTPRRGGRSHTSNSSRPRRRPAELQSP